MNDRDDPLLDSCLDEVLGGCTPPDLTARILHALQSGVAQPPIPNPTTDVLTQDTLEPPPLADTPQIDLRVEPAKKAQGNRQSSHRHRSKRTKSGSRGKPISISGSRDTKNSISAALRTGSESLTTLARPANKKRKQDTRFLVGMSVVAASVVAMVAIYMAVRTSSSSHDVVNNPSKSRSKQGIANRFQAPKKDRVNPEVRRPVNGFVGPVEAGPDSETSPPAPSDSGSPPETQPVAQLAVESPQFVRRPADNVPVALTDAEIIGIMDRQVERLWEVSAITPASKAPDRVWGQRLYRRLLLREATSNELAEFEKEGVLDRGALIEKLISGEEFAATWAEVWTNTLLGPDELTTNQLARRGGLKEYLRESFGSDKPWDAITFELITAIGSNNPDASDYNGATNFLLAGVQEHATVATDRTASVFLGQRVRCVQCHELSATTATATWSQEQFWQLNAYFSQTHGETDGKYARLVDRDFHGQGGSDTAKAAVEYERTDGAKRLALPALANNSSLTATSGLVKKVRRRVELGYALTTSDDWSLSTVNRVWTHFFGYGLVNPVDEMGVGKRPVSPELLEHLAGQFRANNHDMKSLVRWIASSRSFGLSSQRSLEALADVPSAGRPMFSHFYERPDTVGVRRSLELVAQARETDGADSQRDRARRIWLRQFRGSTPDLADDLHSSDLWVRLQNSPIIMTDPLSQQAASHQYDGVLTALIESQKLSQAEKIDHLFLAATSRRPMKSELKVVEKLLEKNKGEEAVFLQDLWWALLNSRESSLSLGP